MSDDEIHKPGTGSTGPKTPEGKARSSQNGVKHGCRATQLIIRGENEDEFYALQLKWLREFQPSTDAMASLVEKLIIADWRYQRTERELLNAEAKFAEQVEDWTEWPAEFHHKLQLLTRYKTTAERGFQRWWNAASQLRKNTVQEALAYERLRLQVEARAERTAEKRVLAEKTEAKKDTAKPRTEEKPLTKAEALFQGQDHPKKLGKVQVLDQWVEIRVADGKTSTTLYPPNEELIKEGKKMLPPPTLVYRRLNFVDGVPPEYRWATGEENWERGGCGIQRMDVDTWLQVIEEEAASGTGMIMRVPNLPRPKERGGCECEVCTWNAERLERSE